MIVVSDTTPLISLLKIRKLDLLKELFETVQIPDAVFSELTTNKRFKAEAEEILDCDFIKTVSVDKESVQKLIEETGLDIGETEAIVLSESVKADLTLIDERSARNIAKQRGIVITGTVGILARAFGQGLINAKEIQDCAEILHSEGRYISESLLDALLNLAK